MESRFRLTWDDVFVLSGGMLLGALLALVVPTWVVALAPLWCVLGWLVWQFARAIHDAA